MAARSPERLALLFFLVALDGLAAPGQAPRTAPAPAAAALRAEKIRDNIFVLRGGGLTFTVNGVDLPQAGTTLAFVASSGVVLVDTKMLLYFGRAHTSGDAWVVFPALRVLHAGDAFNQNVVPLLDRNNGASGVEYPQTIARAAASLGDIDTVITGHYQTALTMGDLGRRRGGVERNEIVRGEDAIYVRIPLG